MDSSVRAVAVVGLGRMGTALAGAMARSDHTVTVWNRTASRATPLRDLGVSVADSLAAACAASEFVLVSVTDYDTTRALLDGEGVAAALQGSVLVQLTSGTPSEARELAEWAERARHPLRRRKDHRLPVGDRHPGGGDLLCRVCGCVRISQASPRGAGRRAALRGR